MMYQRLTSEVKFLDKLVHNFGLSHLYNTLYHHV